MQNISFRNGYLRIFAILAVTGVFAWSLYWYIGAATISRNVENWIAKNNVMFDQPLVKIKGYPFRYRIELNRVAWPAQLGRVAVAKLVLNARPWSVTEIEALGEDISWSGPSFGLTLERMAAQIDVDSQGLPETISLSLVDLAPKNRAEFYGIGRISELELSGAFRIVERASYPAHVKLQATGIDPGPAVQEFSDQPGWLALDFDVHGNLGGLSEAAVTAWRSDDGKIEIKAADLSWDRVRISAQGDLALDGRLQPTASTLIRADGLDQVVERLEKSGRIERTAAAVMRLALTLFSNPAAGGGPSVKLPLAVAEGRVMIGPLKIAKIPHIQWPPTAP